VLLLAALAGCGGGGIGSAERNDLSAMETGTITIKGQAFQVWIARTASELEHGLMQVTDAEIAPMPDGTRRGMLFVFTTERPLAFWMMNTIIPLDIVYIRGDGQIVSRYTMAPLETRLYPSIEPALFALEVSAGTFEALSIGPGDHVDIPSSLLKSTP